VPREEFAGLPGDDPGPPGELGPTGMQDAYVDSLRSDLSRCCRTISDLRRQLTEAERLLGYPIGAVGGPGCGGHPVGPTVEAHCPHGSRRITSCEDCLVRERGGDLTPAMKEMFDRERGEGEKQDTAPDEHGFGDEVLHRVWTKAVGTEGYDKAEWRELEALVHAGITARKPTVTNEEQAIGHVFGMGAQSLDPMSFEALEDLLTKIVRARHLGRDSFRPR